MWGLTAACSACGSTATSGRKFDRNTLSRLRRARRTRRAGGRLHQNLPSGQRRTHFGALRLDCRARRDWIREPHRASSCVAERSR